MHFDTETLDASLGDAGVAELPALGHRKSSFKLNQ